MAKTIKCGRFRKYYVTRQKLRDGTTTDTVSCGSFSASAGAYENGEPLTRWVRGEEQEHQPSVTDRALIDAALVSLNG